jgi:hypothetical protein
MSKIRNLFILLKNIFNVKKDINLKLLPSQGLFYKDDFQITIKSATRKDIDDYEKNYTKDDISTVIYHIKRTVENNTILTNGYSYDDIKSIDMIFIFLEIVKLTKGKAISLIYFDVDINKSQKIEFSSNNFNYFKLKELIKFYKHSEKCFEIEGYKYTLPSIGVENSLTNFLILKSNEPGSSKYNNYTYDFTHFVGHKSSLKYREIENLIQIFNFDMDQEECYKIENIIKTFSPIQRYSLKKDGKVVEMTSKINLEKIWR